MSNMNFLIGNGQMLIDPIKKPKGPNNPGKSIYTFDEAKDRLLHYLHRNKLGNATSLVFPVINSAIIGRLINLDLRDRKTRICHSIIEVSS